MANVVHLWNVSKFLEKITNPEVAKLQMHYVRCCRELGDTVDLPRQNFGPAVLCPSCGSTWATTAHKTRILPKRLPPLHIEKLIRVTQDTGLRLPKHRRTLAQKSDGNRTNKIVKICSVCSGRAKFSLSKPERKRRKPRSKQTLDDSQIKMSSKKRKKRTKDKAAGLNLSGIVTPEAKSLKDSAEDRHHTPLLFATKRKNPSKPNTPVATPKPQKLNLSKLQGLFSSSATPSKKNNLRTFLQEL